MEVDLLSNLLNEAINEVLEDTVQFQSTPKPSEKPDPSFDRYDYLKKTDKSFQTPNNRQAEDKPETYRSSATYSSREQTPTYETYQKPDPYQSFKKPVESQSYRNAGTEQGFRKPDTYQKPDNYQSYQRPETNQRPSTSQPYRNPNSYESYNKPNSQNYHQVDASHSYENSGLNQNYQKPYVHPKPDDYQTYQRPGTNQTYQNGNTSQSYQKPDTYQSYQKPNSQSYHQPTPPSPYFDSYDYFKKTDKSFQTTDKDLNAGTPDPQTYHKHNAYQSYQKPETYQPQQTSETYQYKHKPATSQSYQRPETYQNPSLNTQHRRDVFPGSEPAASSQTSQKPPIYKTYKHPDKLASEQPSDKYKLYTEDENLRFVGPDKPPPASQAAKGNEKSGKDSEYRHEDVVGPNIISRGVWGALPPMGTINPMKPPTKALVFTLNTQTPPCFTHKECCRTVRQIQAKHMGEGLPDIQHNFLMGGDGNLYEGRGWWQESGIQREDGQGSNYNIAFIGDYQSDPSKIPKHMLTPVQDLIFYGNAIKLMEGGIEREVPENKVKPTPDVPLK